MGPDSSFTHRFHSNEWLLPNEELASQRIAGEPLDEQVTLAAQTARQPESKHLGILAKDSVHLACLERPVSLLCDSATPLEAASPILHAMHWRDGHVLAVAAAVVVASAAQRAPVERWPMRDMSSLRIVLRCKLWIHPAAQARAHVRCSKGCSVDLEVSSAGKTVKFHHHLFCGFDSGHGSE